MFTRIRHQKNREKAGLSSSTGIDFFRAGFNQLRRENEKKKAYNVQLHSYLDNIDITDFKGTSGETLRDFNGRRMNN